MEKEALLWLGVAGRSSVDEKFVVKPKCPLKDEWVKRYSIYTMEYYSAIKIMN